MQYTAFLNLIITFLFGGDDSYSISILFDSGSASYQSSSLSGNQSSSKDELREAEPVGISPRGQLASIVNLMSDYTKLQRDEVIEKIHNKVIDWTLPIYEVRKINSNNYEINILPDTNVGCQVYINNPDEGEVQTLRQIKTGEYINFKGRIADITPTRYLVIKPAIIYGDPITNMQKATFVYKEYFNKSRTHYAVKLVIILLLSSLVF